MDLKKILKWLLLALILFALFCMYCRPVVILHYAANATKPVAYFYDEDSDTTKAYLAPGRTKKFYSTVFQGKVLSINISFPLENGGGIEITEPFSRVDVYISADAKITKVDKKTGFFDRF